MEEQQSTATNREGMGSTYAGTQSPDPKAPDGYQPPTAEEAAEGSTETAPANEPDTGREYDTGSSYGDKNSRPDQEGGVAEQGSSKEEGDPIR